MASRKKIALVEDNPDNMLLLQVMLEDLFELQQYEEGTSAAEGIVRDPPDLVLMDISLPGIDGVEVLHRIRQHPRLESLPVIALTAHAMVGDRERFLTEGFDYYIPKPIIGSEQLLGPIERFIG